MKAMKLVAGAHCAILGAILGATLGAAIQMTIPTGAFAADMATPLPAKAPLSAPASSWTGFYFGLNGGYGWGNQTASYTPNDPAALQGTCGGVGGGTCIPAASYRLSGGLFGGQAGYNWQANSSWLIGVETDYQWANINAAATSGFHLGSVENTGMVANERVESFGTLRARVGFLPTNPLLIYATGGLAYGRVSENLLVPNLVPAGAGGDTAGGFSYTCAAGGPPCFAGSSANTMVGWTIGAGGEGKLTDNVSLKVEYLYVSLGNLSGTATALATTGANTPASFTANLGPVSFNVIRAGLNVKF